jgi:hypothetical protein
MTIPLPSKLSDLTELSVLLNQRSHVERVSWMRDLNSKELEAMYVLAHGGPSLELGHFHAAQGEVVIHHGQNSLPAFNAFQKRVVDNDGILQGYNHQALSWITGPGHFTLRQDGNDVLFDYTSEPTNSFDSFPPLKSNTSGISTLVYGHMVDRVRRVSDHCVIGAAFKKGKAMGAWFMLIREGTLPIAN